MHHLALYRARGLTVHFVFVASALLALFSAPIFAQTWTGGTGNWDNASNWSPTVVPDSNTAAVLIDGGVGGTSSNVTLGSTRTVNSLTIDLGDTLSLTGNFEKLNFSGTTPSLNNAGTIQSSAGNVFVELDFFGTVGATATNSGTIQVSGGADVSFTMPNIVFDNTGGSINVTGSTSFFRFRLGTEVQGGDLSASNNGILFFANGGGIADSTIALTNNGRMILTASFTLDNTVVNVDASKVETFPNFPDTDPVRLINGSSMNMSAGLFDLDGGVGATVDVTSTLQGDGSISSIGALPTNFENQGLVDANVTSEVLQLDGATMIVTNTGTMRASNGGTLRLDGVTVDNTGGLFQADNGTVDFLTGTPLTGGDFQLLNNGTFNFADGLTLGAGQNLGGNGTVNGNVTNTGGAVTPGASPGIMNIFGDYTQGPGGSTTFQIGGEIPGFGPGFHDQLAITGTADLDGTILIELFGGFVPPFGSSTYDLIAAGGFILQPGLTFDFPTLAGASFGIEQVIIPGGDFRVLRLTVFNEIPEPASLSLLAFGALGLLRRRPRFR